MSGFVPVEHTSGSSSSNLNFGGMPQRAKEHKDLWGSDISRQ